MRIWFNKTFSTIGAVFRQLKAGYPNGEVTIVCTHTHRTATAFLAADEAYLEPSELQGLDYIVWCLDFCREHRIGLFGRARKRPWSVKIGNSSRPLV